MILFGSCKSSFEKVRTSNDPEKMYIAANKYYDEGSYSNAQILYELIIPYYRGKKEAEDLYYRYAYTYYNLKDYMLASHYFKNFAASFYNSPRREEAMYMSAYGEYLMSPEPRLEQSKTNEAIEDFQLFINTYPNSDKVDKCNHYIDQLRKKQEDKAFREGELYYNLGHYNATIISLENLLKEFPETKREEEVRFLILKSSFNYAKNSIYEKRLERYEDAEKKYKEFVTRYPKSKEMDKANKINENSKTEINKLKNGH